MDKERQNRRLIGKLEGVVAASVFLQATGKFACFVSQHGFLGAVVAYSDPFVVQGVAVIGFLAVYHLWADNRRPRG